MFVPHRRRPFWLMFVDTPGEGGDPPPATPPAGTPPAGPPDKGYPDGTPVADMTAQEQAAYWKHHSRTWESRAKAMGDYDELKAKAAELDKVRAEQMTEQEKAVTAAKAEGRSEATREANEQAAKAILRAALGARDVPADTIEKHARFVNVAEFIGDGGLDDEALVEYAISLAGSPAAQPVPDMGQGRRGEGPKTSEADKGRAAARKRYGLPDPE